MIPPATSPPLEKSGRGGSPTCLFSNLLCRHQETNPPTETAGPFYEMNLNNRHTQSGSTKLSPYGGRAGFPNV